MIAEGVWSCEYCKGFVWEVEEASRFWLVSEGWPGSQGEESIKFEEGGLINGEKLGTWLVDWLRELCKPETTSGFTVVLLFKISIGGTPAFIAAIAAAEAAFAAETAAAATGGKTTGCFFICIKQ